MLLRSPCYVHVQSSHDARAVACAWVCMRQAAPVLQPAVGSPTRSEAALRRGTVRAHSRGGGLSSDGDVDRDCDGPDPVLANVLDRISAETMVPATHFHPVLHVQAVPSGAAGTTLPRHDAVDANRMVTVLLFLSDVEDGGEVVFTVRVAFRFGVFFFGVRPARLLKLHAAETEELLVFRACCCLLLCAFCFSCELLSTVASVVLRVCHRTCRRSTMTQRGCSRTTARRRQLMWQRSNSGACAKSFRRAQAPCARVCRETRFAGVWCRSGGGVSYICWA
jgi:hypothetical protein